MTEQTEQKMKMTEQTEQETKMTEQTEQETKMTEQTEQTEQKMWTVLKRQRELKTMVLVTVEININVDVQAACYSPDIQAIQNRAAKKYGGRTCKRKSKHHGRAGELPKANITGTNLSK